MSIKTKLTIYFLVIFLVFSVVSSFSIYKNYSDDKSFNQKISQAVNLLEISSKQSLIAQMVRYDDEVLTQSARNYAFTGEKKWKDRYFEFVPKLDLRIKEAVSLGDEKDREIFNSINISNLSLVKMEEEAISLADKKDFVSAQKILNSPEYDKQKEAYQAGLARYLSSHSISLDENNPISEKFLADSEEHFLVVGKTGTYLIFGLILLFIGVVIFLFWVILYIFMRPLAIFKKTAKEIIGGNLEAVVNIKDKDEIGEFASDFNMMTKTLRDSLQNTENKVIEKTNALNESKNVLEKALSDADRMNRLMVDRELEMINLKKQIAELKNKK